MAKETITMTRDLFDEMIQAATDKERNRVIQLLEELNIGRCCFESHDLIALIEGENKLTYEAIIAEIQKSTDILIKGENK